MKLWAWTGCITLITGVSATAQDGSEASSPRTIEGAQKFLSQIYAQGGTEGTLQVYQQGSEVRTERTDGGSVKILRGAIRGVGSVDRCQSTVTYAGLSHKRYSVRDPQTPFGSPDAELVRTIDWGKATAVVVQKDWLSDGQANALDTGWHQIVVQMRDDNGLAFLHRSEEEAKRAAFAMEFLRDECGLKSDTGF
jgi:hypothetical protein